MWCNIIAPVHLLSFTSDFSPAVILCLVVEVFLLLWAYSRNVWAWRCWICGVWQKRETRVSERSARQQGTKTGKTHCTVYTVWKDFTLQASLQYSHSSYKSCLPETHRRDIQRLSRLARYQIRKTLKRFLRKLGDCSAGVRNLKLKYLMELSTVEPAYGSESFKMHHSGWLEQSEQKRVKSIRVSGEGGIQIQTTEHQVGLWIGFYLNYLKEN